MENRITWPKVWMNLAVNISERSYDDRLKVGCVIVSRDNTSVLAVGYNGNAHGLPNARESELPGESGLLHAEQNAVVKLDYHNPAQKIVYLTHSPCPMCAKLLIQARIHKVIYRELFRDIRGLSILDQGNIQHACYDDVLEKAEQGIPFY